MSNHNWKHYYGRGQQSDPSQGQCALGTTRFLQPDTMSGKPVLLQNLLHQDSQKLNGTLKKQRNNQIMFSREKTDSQWVSAEKFEKNRLQYHPIEWNMTLYHIANGGVHLPLYLYVHRCDSIVV
jgi:hypothetical protein